jgi:hypothetical protein
MHPIQFLYIKAYKETVDIYGIKLRNNTRIRLDSKSINEDEFMFIAVKGHSDEFVRLFRTKAMVKISTEAKDKAFVEVIKNGHSKEMICELLKDCVVNATISFEFKYHIESQYRSTALQWACLYDYIDVVLLLLKYDNVDISAKDGCSNQPIHYAAALGHTESNSF